MSGRCGAGFVSQFHELVSRSLHVRQRPLVIGIADSDEQLRDTRAQACKRAIGTSHDCRRRRLMTSEIAISIVDEPHFRRRESGRAEHEHAQRSEDNQEFAED